MKLILYGTEGCHLCDEAQTLIESVLPDHVILSKVDILSDDALYERYQLKIPVLEFRETKKQLHWPFSCQQVKLLLNLKLK